MEKKDMVCIVCPMSCKVTFDLDENGGITKVEGHTCPRGENYVRKELTNPTRMLTSTIKIEGAFYDRLPVITSSDIPKSKLFEVMKEINKTVVKAPIKAKDVLIADVCGLGVNIIASRSMQAVDGK